MHGTSTELFNLQEIKNVPSMYYKIIVIQTNYNKKSIKNLFFDRICVVPWKNRL